MSSSPHITSLSPLWGRVLLPCVSPVSDRNPSLGSKDTSHTLKVQALLSKLTHSYPKRIFKSDVSPKSGHQPSGILLKTFPISLILQQIESPRGYFRGVLLNQKLIMHWVSREHNLEKSCTGGKEPHTTISQHQIPSLFIQLCL